MFATAHQMLLKRGVFMEKNAAVEIFLAGKISIFGKI